MRASWHSWPIVLLAAGFGVVATAHAAGAVELKNDGFTSGGSAVFQGGFATGDIGAARLTPGSGTFVVTKVRFLFGDGMGGAVSKDVTVHVWDDPGVGDNPGTELFTGDFTLTASDAALQEIDLTAMGAAPVIVSGPFRVGVEFMHTGFPGIARDADGTIAADHNFIFSTTWFKSNVAGLTGDWILRAEVLPVGATPDAGPAPGPDAMPGSKPDATPGSAMCFSNSQCPIGQYCGATGACTFDCRANADCPGGGTCNSLGKCVGGSAGGGGGGGCATGGSGGAGNRNGALAALGLACLTGIAWATRRRR